MRYQSWVRSMSEKRERDLNFFWGLFFLCAASWICIYPFEARAHDALEHEYDEVSIGFAAQNTYQPESAFGHVFLIFHQATIAPDALVLEFVGRVNSFADAVRTLVGEVPGHYLVQTYAEKRRQYDLEDRGLYIANLRLSKEEIRELMQEVRQRAANTYPYDFAKKNCAYYLADLLTMIEPRMKEVKQDSIVQPVEVMKTAVVARELDIDFLPSSRELYLNRKNRLSIEDHERFELFLKGHIPVLDGQDFQNTLAAFLRYRIPREAVTWRRQHYAHVQKYVYVKDESMGALTAFDEGMKGHFEAAIGSEKLSLSYRPQQENFYSQSASVASYAYLDLFSTEVSLDHEAAWLSSFKLLSSKSMNLEQGTARLLELGYRDWRGVTEKSEKEIFATFGVGISGGNQGRYLSVVPLVGVAAGSVKKTKAELRLGLEITGEVRTSRGSMGVDVQQWFGSHLTPNKLYKFKAKYPLSKSLNLGYERMWVSGQQVLQHQIKLIYSVR